MPNGLDIMFNIVRLFLSAHPEWIACGTDARTAFPKIPRAQFLRALRSHKTLKNLFPFAATCYLYPSSIFYGELYTYLSEEGAQQGCPFGTLVWCVGIQQLLVNTALKFPTVLILAYADDIWLLGPGADVRNALVWLNGRLRALKTEGGALEFSFEGKTWVYSHGEDTLADLAAAGVVFPAGTVLIPTSEGYKGLGCFASANPRWLEQAAVVHFG